MKLVYKSRLKRSPELQEVLKLYETGAIKTITKARGILEGYDARAVRAALWYASPFPRGLSLHSSAQKP